MSLRATLSALPFLLTLGAATGPVLPNTDPPWDVSLIDRAVLAAHTTLDGIPLREKLNRTLAGCLNACRDYEGCSWINWKDCAEVRLRGGRSA